MDQLSSATSSYHCQEHDNEPVTNFCSNMDCLKPLCPECIDIHNKFHHSQSTLPQIASVKNAKSMCGKKLKAALAALHQELENPILNAIIDPTNAIKEEMKKLREVKEKLNEIIDHHLQTLEVNLKKNINRTHTNSNDALEIYEKMKSMISELESLHRDLHTNNSLGVLKKICSLDLKTMMNKFKAEMGRALQKRSSEGVSAIYDDSFTEAFKDILGKLVGLSKETDIHKNNNTQISYSSPPKTGSIFFFFE